MEIRSRGRLAKPHGAAAVSWRASSSVDVAEAIVGGKYVRCLCRASRARVSECAPRRDLASVERRLVFLSERYEMGLASELNWSTASTKKASDLKYDEKQKKSH